MRAGKTDLRDLLSRHRLASERSQLEICVMVVVSPLLLGMANFQAMAIFRSNVASVNP